MEHLARNGSVGYGWFENRDRDTKFFHRIIKGKRNSLKISRITDDFGCWIENQAQITGEAISFY